VTIHRLTRRSFIERIGKGTLAIAVLGPAACSDGSATTPAPSAATTSTVAPVTPATPTTTASPGEVTTTAPPSAATATAIDWRRVDLGFVSAYVLARNDRAVIVDTGNPGSEGEIEAALGAVGLGWTAVDHVILTHLHADHVGSLGAVADNAAAAALYAGEADIGGISSPRPLRPVGDGDEVVGLQIVDTPGHTPGHIAVYDPMGLVLVAGDALNTSGGSVAGSEPRFTADQAAADASVQKLAQLDFEVLYVGHGEPIAADADAAVLGLADSI
jgi:glyoxylase-like metal-dependent hydrolase (beta-lactamase superfamily II)